MAAAGSGGAVGWNVPDYSHYGHPPGYQPPDQSAPGFPVMTKDQESAKGAPAGYEWDPVQKRYVPSVSSATTAKSLQDQLRGLATNSTSSSSSSGSGTGTGAGAGAGGSFPTVSYPGGGSQPNPGTYGSGGGSVGAYPSAGAYPSIAPVDTTGAENAAFNRAKDKVGQVSQGALSGLRSSLGGRGLLGSGAESRGTQGVINAGQAELGDVIRQNAITSAENAQQNAIANYQGQIGMRGQDIGANTTMRGQDIGERETQYQGGITQRGQDVQASAEANRTALLQNQLAWQKQQAQQSLALEALKGIVPGLTSTLQY